MLRALPLLGWRPGEMGRTSALVEGEDLKVGEQEIQRDEHHQRQEGQGSLLPAFVCFISTHPCGFPPSRIKVCPQKALKAANVKFPPARGEHLRAPGSAGAPWSREHSQSPCLHPGPPASTRRQMDGAGTAWKPHLESCASGT